MESLLLSIGADDSVPVPIRSIGMSMVPAAVIFCEVWVPCWEGVGAKDIERDWDHLCLFRGSLWGLPTFFSNDL